MENRESILLSKFEKYIGFSSTFFDGNDWRNSDYFAEGYKLAQKEFETERQYWLDKEAEYLRTNTEIINSKYSAEES